MKTLKIKFALVIAASLCGLAAHAGVKEVGGGDPCENQIKVIARDLKGWINDGGPNGLELPAELSAEKYSDRMLKQIETAKVSCVAKGDEDYPVEVEGVPKVCKFKVMHFGGSYVICDRLAFLALNESAQYELIHHEFAGLAGIESPKREDSKYDITNQITSFLTDKVVKRLAVKRVPDNSGGEWEEIEGKAGPYLAKSLQQAMLAAKFSDCKIASYYIRKEWCEDLDYAHYEFAFYSPALTYGFSGIPVGEFRCGKQNSPQYSHFLVRSRIEKMLKNIIKTVYKDDDGKERPKTVEVFYHFNEAESDVTKVVLRDSKVTLVNEGTKLYPLWKEKTVVSEVTCNAGEK